MLHDTHAHLDLLLQRLGNLPPESELNLESGKLPRGLEISLDKKLIDNLLNQHEFVVQPSVSTENFYLSYNLFCSFTKVYFLIGSHPEIVKPGFDIENYLDKQRNLIVDLESNKEMMYKVIGIGECGLDYYYTKDAKLLDKQKGLFEEQIVLAIKLKLPLIIHCREAFKDVFDILKEYPDIHGHFLIHCFTGGIEEIKEALDLGGKIGIGGICTYKSADNLREAIKYSPLESIVLETDLPFLAPTPHRSGICIPEMIDIIAEKVGELKKESKARVWEFSRENAISLFGLSI